MRRIVLIRAAVYSLLGKVNRKASAKDNFRQLPRNCPGYVLMQAVNPRLMWADKRWTLTLQNDGVVRDICCVCDTGCGSKADPQCESLRLALSRKRVGFGLLRDGGL